MQQKLVGTLTCSYSIGTWKSCISLFVINSNSLYSYFLKSNILDLLNQTLSKTIYNYILHTYNNYYSWCRNFIIAQMKYYILLSNISNISLKGMSLGRAVYHRTSCWSHLLYFVHAIRTPNVRNGAQVRRRRYSIHSHYIQYYAI